MNTPEDLRYSTDHEWALLLKAPDGDAGESTQVRIGITDYAQDALGDVVFVELPTVGQQVDSGGTFGEVESTKSVSDLFAPIAGVIAQINDALVDNPELVNEDPYGDGWICTITANDVADLDGLMDAEAYRALTED